MRSSECPESNVNADSVAEDERLRLAIAVSFLRSRIQNLRSSPSSSSRCGIPSDVDALRWKQKAKERKQEIIRLREDLKEAESCLSIAELCQISASCKCYFFDNLGKFSPQRIGGASNLRFNDVLRRRFLRLVRAKERRKTTSLSQRFHISERKYEDEAEQLRISADFLVQLCETGSHGTSNFSNWSHQAVDFVLDSLKNLLAIGKHVESIEGSVSSLITQLISRMCSPLKVNEAKQSDKSFQFYIQHLIRKLGSESYIGQRAIFSVSQRISVLAESLLFVDPFDESFPEMHECMLLLIQLIEFLISDYLLSWSEDEAFETGVLEEWITSVVHARKAVEALEDRNGLYVLYMDRAIGELAKQVAQISSFQDLESEILVKLFA